MNNFDPVEILIVEDNPHDAELMVRALKKEKLANQIHIVEDGEEAIDFVFCKNQYANRNPGCSPKVIFLDIKLPKVNGLEVVCQLKSNASTKKIPVVMVTSSKEDPDIRRAYEFGANGYVVKPVDFGDFAKTMNHTGLFWILVNECPKLA